MSLIDDLQERNAAFTAGFDRQDLPSPPQLKLAVVACMDARLNVAAALGLGPGEAHVIRNAGGAVTDDVIRSLSISQRKLGTRSIVLIQHTKCGMQTITDDGFRAELQEETGQAPPFAIESFSDLEANVRQSLARLKSSPFLLDTSDVHGFVYDVDSGELRRVEEA